MLKTALLLLLSIATFGATFGCATKSSEQEEETTDQAFSSTWTLAYAQHKPTQVAVDATHVYWTAYKPSDDAPPFVHHHDVMRAPKIGGGLVETLASGEAGLVTFALDATHVYWLTQSPSTIASSCSLGGPGTGAAKRIAKTGGTVEVIASGFACGNPSVSSQMVVDTANIWFSGNDGIRILPKSGGGPPGALTLAAAAGPNPHASIKSTVLLREDADAIYWGDSYGPLWAQQKIGGAKVKLLDMSPWDAALDASFLYFVRDAKVWRVAKQANSAPAVAEELGATGGGFDSASAVVVDDTHVYYSSTREKAVRRIPKTPGAGSSQSFAIGETAHDLAIDASSVFFPHYGTPIISMAPEWVPLSGAIRRRTKQ